MVQEAEEAQSEQPEREATDVALSRGVQLLLRSLSRLASQAAETGSSTGFVEHLLAWDGAGAAAEDEGAPDEATGLRHQLIAREKASR